MSNLEKSFMRYAELVRAKCARCGRKDLQLANIASDPCGEPDWRCGYCLRETTPSLLDHT